MTRGMEIHYSNKEARNGGPGDRGENSMATRSTRLTRPARSMTIADYAN